MNLVLLKRAVERHRHMKDTPAYRVFLEEISRYDGVWKASQSNIAEWWEQRQRAALVLQAGEGRMTVASDLPGCVVEVGERLLVPPVALDISPEVLPGEVVPEIACPNGHEKLLEELLGHLGYNHVRVAAPSGVRADPQSDRLRSVLDVLKEISEVHQKYDVKALGELREILSGIHEEAGVPDVRIWTLPHSGGKPYKVAVSTRYDVDKAIINLPAINRLEARFGLSSTAYLRPFGMFYGRKEIAVYTSIPESSEIALHGEFVSTAEKGSGDEFEAAMKEKRALEEMTGREIKGVCMHGGELRSNTSPNTYDAIERAGFMYNTLFRNSYYHPLHVMKDGAVGRTLSIGQHFADITVRYGPRFVEDLVGSFMSRFDEARKAGGVFVPVLHPLYFDLGRYLRNLENLARLAGFVPRYLVSLGRVKKSQNYVNQ